MALDAGAAVMATSHLRRPTEGAFKPADSLAPLAARLGELLGREVPLRANWVDGVAVQPGQVMFLENCRVNKGEKKNDEALAKKIAAIAKYGIEKDIGYISTGGGAFLEVLEGKTLPAFEILQRRAAQ